MANVGPDTGGNPGNEAEPRLTLNANEARATDAASSPDTEPVDVDDVSVTNVSEGPYRRFRADTLESVDGERGRANRSGRSGQLKTVEQLRTLHPEKGLDTGDYERSLDQRAGLLKSIATDLKRFFSKTSDAARKRREASGVMPSCDWRKSFEAVPLIMTLREYQKDWFAPDLAAGLTEGIMCIPLGMSYALLANIPSVYGLYTGLVPPLMYMLFGTCPQLSLGVSAIESLLVADGVSKVIGDIGEEIDENTTQEDIDAKVQFTIAFALAVGCWQILMRVFGLGGISVFLSDPVLSGFSTASAFQIGTSQLSHLFGYDLGKASLPVMWFKAITNVHNFNYIALAIGVCGIVALYACKALNNKLLPKVPLPYQVVVVAFATLFVWIFDWDVSILEHIPDGLPPFMVPSFPTVNGIGGLSDYLVSLLVQSFLVAVLCYIITISIAKTFARINDNVYKINGGQELVAMSTANIVGSMFQIYPASGSLSRTAVINSIGCKSRLHAIPAVFVVGLTLLAITPLLYTLPKSILSSVVLVGVVKMVDFRDAQRLYHLSKPDFFLWNVSFWVTFLVGPTEGIFASVAISLLYLIKQSARPANSILGRLPETREYRNIKRFPMAKEIPGIRIFRFDADLHFANKDFFENRLKALEENPCEGVPIHTIVLDASSINQLDASALDMLIVVAKSYAERGVSMLCANWKGPQRDLLELSDFYVVIPPANLFLGLHDAVVEARKRASDGTNEPLLAPAAESPTSVKPASIADTGAQTSSHVVADTVVEIGPDGETREWRVGAVEVTPGGEVEREWGMGRV